MWYVSFFGHLLTCIKSLVCLRPLFLVILDEEYRFRNQD